MNGYPWEPACWSWSLAGVLTQEQEAQRLYDEAMELVNSTGSMDHYLPLSACRMLTRNWPNYLLGAWHDERCAICGVRPGHLVHDHDHRTGLVRGRLCRGCNVSEGRSGDRDLYAMYREKNPATILGVQIYYVGRGWEDDWWRDEALARRLTGNPDWVPMVKK